MAASLLRILSRARWLVLAALLAGTLTLLREDLPAGTPRGLARRRSSRVWAGDRTSSVSLTVTEQQPPSTDDVSNGRDDTVSDGTAQADDVQGRAEALLRGQDAGDEPDGVEEEGEAEDTGGAKGEQEESVWFKLMKEQTGSQHHGRDQSKFAFDRDEVPDRSTWLRKREREGGSCVLGRALLEVVPRRRLTNCCRVAGVLERLVWEEQVPIYLHQGCQTPEPR
jgi:hypothetical protein